VAGNTTTFLLSAVLTILVGCQPVAYKIVPVPLDKELEETVVGGQRHAADKVAVVAVSGLLADEYRRGLLVEGENPVALLQENLDRAAADRAVRAVVVRINSPGGTVTASDLMYSQIRSFRERTGKPVIAVLMDVAASGGYYVACACDHIIAHPTTVTGSIGVMMQTFSLAGTMQKLGIRADAIKSGPYKDAGSPLRDLKKAEREVFQNLIDEFYGRFLHVVASGRPDLSAERIRELADGRVYSGEQACELGLVDQIGTIGDAVTAACERADIAEARVVRYHRPDAWRPNVYANVPSDVPTTINLVSLQLGDWPACCEPRFLYLWSPGL
jgi:protease-4